MGTFVQRIKSFFAERKQKRMSKQEVESKKAVLNELFNDMYDNRQNIYKVNFVRGIFFGLGSVIGGTVVVAVVVWALSFFVNVPVLGELFETTQQSIEQTTDNTSQ